MCIGFGVLAGISFAGGFVGQLIYGTLRDTALSRRMAGMEEDIISLNNSIKGSRSMEAKAEREAEMTQALVEAKTIWESQDPDKMKKIAALAMKYPTVAKMLMKQFGVGNLLG